MLADTQCIKKSDPSRTPTHTLSMYFKVYVLTSIVHFEC